MQQEKTNMVCNQREVHGSLGSLRVLVTTAV